MLILYCFCISDCDTSPTIFWVYYVGYIDLSKRRVSPEDITKCEERYMKSKTVASIMRHVASKLPSGSLDVADSQAPVEAAQAAQGEKESKKSRRARQTVQEEDGDEAGGAGANEEERLEKLYDAVAWPLGKTYGHPYDAFKLALTYVFLSLTRLNFLIAMCMPSA